MERFLGTPKELYFCLTGGPIFHLGHGGLNSPVIRSTAIGNIEYPAETRIAATKYVATDSGYSG